MERCTQISRLRDNKVLLYCIVLYCIVLYCIVLYSQQSSETFVFRIYNLHRIDSIDAARQLLFSKTGKREAMAPTSDALRYHLKRVHYQSMIWRNAPCLTPELPAPSEMGGRLVDSELQPVLMTLSPISDSCLEMVACSCRK